MGTHSLLSSSSDIVVFRCEEPKAFNRQKCYRGYVHIRTSFPPTRHAQSSYFDVSRHRDFPALHGSLRPEVFLIFLLWHSLQHAVSGSRQDHVAQARGLGGGEGVVRPASEGVSDADNLLAGVSGDFAGRLMQVVEHNRLLEEAERGTEQRRQRGKQGESDSINRALRSPLPDKGREQKETSTVAVVRVDVHSSLHSRLGGRACLPFGAPSGFPLRYSYLRVLKVLRVDCQRAVYPKGLLENEWCSRMSPKGLYIPMGRLVT
ncbi:uncharacterized protein K489DRAFT_403429 [Dissoconium aciculare CBS 342.82]|uniref:Uncharacterized protein n=1 Tax=Dissoconium aciculare CBS 342.82 TaxID=1314786 RepID=A0A6J3LXM0_9PEZI|nr:uncharacterized protein K489DRAFT_403429 [Dissoconium aciculare CBS 342.82]KAF1820039.1 hypothetical protein K489DRAFT_403429 [Dissoconium aciculare CBS 342.82]